MVFNAQYENLDFKIPKESDDYQECSEFVVKSIESIMQTTMDEGKNKIVINTNLRLGIPMENVNKIAGPFIEAWAYEIFADVCENENNEYQLINVEARERLYICDVVLQFKRVRKHQTAVTANVNVKATSNDIKGSGKSPNLTSFAKIRTAYIKDPDFIFIILSIKHKVQSTKDPITKMMMGVMEIVSFNAYDMKYLSDSDISYNPALGSGQLQVRDVHYITITHRNVWQFCQMIDRKCIASRTGYEGWLRYAKQFGWIKNE